MSRAACGRACLSVASAAMHEAKRDGALARFHEAQSRAGSGYATALAEIRAGMKMSCWIWYVFPQLRGLGYSFNAERFAIADLAEAEMYLRDRVLGARLAEITRALEGHVCEATSPTSLTGILGEIDAMKVVSSLTLFGEIARRLEDAQDPSLASFRQSAERVLEAASREDLERCEFTLEQLASETGA